MIIPLLIPANSTPIASDLLVRAGLSVVILLVAVIAGPRLADLAGALPAHVGSVVERVRSGEVSDATEMSKAFSHWAQRVTLLCIWLFALLCLGIVWFWNNPALLPGEGSSKDNIVAVAVRISLSLGLVALTLVLSRFVERAVYANLLRTLLNRNLTLLFSRSSYVAIFITGAVVILLVWNVGIAVPIAVLGLLSVAFSLAMQDVLKNFVSGIYLLIERPFIIGDTISVTANTGTVEDIQMRVTILRTVDGKRVLVPNSLLFSSAVVNMSALHQRRLSVVALVPLTADQVEERILATLASIPDVLATPAPTVILNRASSERKELLVNFWIAATPTTSGDAILADVITRVCGAVKDCDVSIPDAATILRTL